jgi:intein/homing endonuclease
LEYEGSLATLYRKDFFWFVRYNIRDTEILKGFEDTLGYVELANQMVHISSGLFQHVLGTLKLAELATINYCHHKLDNLIVKDLNVPEEDGQIQGAFVLIPQVGVHDMIGSVDITSLYPSSIRSINISPEKLIGQFTAKNDACIAIRNKSAATLRLEFDNGDVLEKTGDEWNTILWDRKLAVSGYGTVFLQDEKGIIPIILEDWFNTRKELQKKKAKAKEDGDKIKATYYDKMQYVYKIKLNSFYGALTNKYFRFFDLRMGESTTSTGRAILLHQCASCCEVLDQKYQPTDVSVYDEKTGKTHVGYSDKWSVVYGDSVSGDTIIETDTGPTPIEQLFQTQYYTCGEREYSNCNNTQTLTYDPSTGHNTFKSVKYVMRHQVNKQMYRVWFGNTNYLDVTEDHSLIGYANSKHNTPGLIEIKPTDIGKNNVNSLILSAELPHTVSISPMNLSKEMYQLIGFIIGDGHVEVKKESGVGLSIGKQDKQEIINTLINPLIEQGWFTSTVHMKNGHDVRLCGVKGWKKLREWLYPNNTKQFPLWVEQETSTNIAHILTGYFSADGFANKNKTIGLCSINPDFIKQTNRLLHMCNIPSNFWTETTENSFNGVYSGTYTIRLTVYDGVKFGNDIGFLQDRKNKNIPTLYSKNKYHRRQHPGFCLIRPTKIEPLHIQPTYVYDIEVEHTHMFYANNILVHNTDSTYFETHTDTTEDAIVIADYVGELVNKTFPKFMRDMFLCQPGFDNIIKTGREIVSDRGIFVKKKRYILHIINDDGYPVDKIKVMGLDTKKTTLPKTVSKKLNGFIERYLKRENWDTVALDIIDYKEELINSPNIMDIGLPKGVKGVELYTTAWKQDSKTRLPGHVAASILYNLSRDEYNDKINPPIVSGMKIKVFYLLQQHGRFRSIAIPGDIEEIPSWFLENFQIDKDAQLQRLVNKPLGNILEAVNLIVPSNQSLLNDSLLEY